MTSTRKQVMAQLVSVCREATRNGQDGFKAIREAFPAVPASVAGEDWWRSVERTIDGEVIRRALASPDHGGGL